jgi:hypothetical protein
LARFFVAVSGTRPYRTPARQECYSGGVRSGGLDDVFLCTSYSVSSTAPRIALKNGYSTT